MFRPASVALVGASKRERSVGQVVAHNLLHGDFSGTVWPVHPEHDAIEGVPAYARVADLPQAPDLGVVCTPPEAVPDIVAALAERGTKGVVVITAGFGEGGDEAGAERRNRMLEAARPGLVRIVGPNCLGVLVPGSRLNASFSHIQPRAGDVAFVTQSGAMVTAMLDWATPRGIGFSHVVSLGGMSDVDFGDMLDYLALDPDTRAILLYVEALTHTRKFMSALRAASRNKHVIVVKGGRHAEGAKAAASHTGALAGSDAVYDAAFARGGALRVGSLEELFDAAETLSSVRRVGGDRLAIVTNGGGLGVLAADALIEEGGHLAELSSRTRTELDAQLPPTWSKGNPVDIIGDAPGSRYAHALSSVLSDPGTDAVLAMHCPVAVADPTEAAQAVIDAVGSRPRKPVFTTWLGSSAVQEARARFTKHHVPTYETPERSVRAFMYLVRHRRRQQMLLETPPSLPERVKPDVDRARRIVAAARADGRTILSEPESKQLLGAYGLPTVRTEAAADADEAGRFAADMGFPVALKIISRDVTHKSDAGGVVLDVPSRDAVVQAAERMQANVRQQHPDARLEGFSVQPMCRRPGSHELILGLSQDAQFGPVVLFGRGGTAVEVIRDQALALPPLNMKLAHRLIEETQVYRMLSGYRGHPRADMDAIAVALVQLSQVAADLGDVKEVDINPLLADDQGAVVLDARVVLMPADEVVPGPDRLAIRPYPGELERDVTLLDGATAHLRPIRPEDALALQEAYAHLTRQDARMRFFVTVPRLSDEMAARLTQIDYDREMALVAVDPREPGVLLGVARLASDPDREQAELAVFVRSELHGRGIGWRLVESVLRYAKQEGIGEVWGDVLAENATMLQLCREVGFEVDPVPEDPGLRRVRYHP